jgi:hypothetical protein
VWRGIIKQIGFSVYYNKVGLNQMERIFHKAVGFQETEKWDIQQQLEMTSDERKKAAETLKKRVYGKNPLDVRAGEKTK